MTPDEELEHTISEHGSHIWQLDGKFHRENGPAVIFSSGTEEWWINGKLHRENGPAIILPDGKRFWYINGKYQYTENLGKNTNLPKSTGKRKDSDTT